MRKTVLIIIIAALFSACNNKGADNKINSQEDYSLAMAVLYNYYSSEYKALTLQAFNTATLRLKLISDTAVSVNKYAVIVDIDETVLDNSPYQARSIIEDFSYPEGWNEWCNEAKADAVPGSLEFLKHADSLGYKIFYVSNRKKESVYNGTVLNLANTGFPQLDDESIMLRMAKTEDNPDPSDKESRREKIREKGYKIVLLAGDNLGDFYTDSASGDLRDRLVMDGQDEFGARFIVLPNAMYGNWPSSIGLDGSREKTRALLQEMSKR